MDDLELTPLELLRAAVGDMPDPDPETGEDPMEQLAHGALAALTSPSAAVAALVEQQILDRMESASPHLVKGTAPTATAPITLGPAKDRPGDPRPEGTVVSGSLQGPVDCPDCTRGTWSAGGTLVCVQLPRLPKIDLQAAKPGDIIACGKER